MTSNKRNLKDFKEANQGQGQIRKESGNSAILYITIMYLTANVNPKKLILKL